MMQSFLRQVLFPAICQLVSLDVYNEPNEFFGGQPIFSTIVEYSSHIPEFTKTPYHYEARECVNTAVVNIVNGTAEDALQEAQDTLAFKMTE